MNVKHAIGTMQFLCTLHGAVLARLITRHVVVVRDLVALVTDVRVADHTELTLVSGIRGEDSILWIEHHHGLRVMLEVRDERANVWCLLLGPNDRRWLGTAGGKA